jgi:DNA-binding transcriptional LysR family regulator
MVFRKIANGPDHIRGDPAIGIQERRPLSDLKCLRFSRKLSQSSIAIHMGPSRCRSMNIDQIKTFLEVAATGNFNRAAENLNITQSTVSARIRVLEEQLGRPLFARSHAGARLTPAGQRLRRYALNMQRLWQRAEQEVALPKAYRASIGLGSQVSLWERLILRWIPRMRRAAPDVAVHVEADYSTSLMRQLGDGVLDIGVMYAPRQTPGLVVEELLVEQLILVSTEKPVNARAFSERSES